MKLAHELPRIFPFAGPRMALLLLCLCFMIGCGSNPAPPANPPVSGASTGPAAKAAGDTNAMMLETNEMTAQVVSFDPLGAGRDPFFPNSRRSPKQESSDNAETVEPPRPLSSYLTLSGLWPSPSRPLAFINKTIFEPGKSAQIKIEIPTSRGTSAVHIVTVLCREIRSNSVAIRVEGERGDIDLKLPNAP